MSPVRATSSTPPAFSAFPVEPSLLDPGVVLDLGEEVGDRGGGVTQGLIPGQVVLVVCERVAYRFAGGTHFLPSVRDTSGQGRKRIRSLVQPPTRRCYLHTSWESAGRVARSTCGPWRLHARQVRGDKAGGSGARPVPRQVDGEGRAPSLRRLDVDPAAVPLHDLVGDVQAQAQAPGVLRLRGAPRRSA